MWLRVQIYKQVVRNPLSGLWTWFNSLKAISITAITFGIIESPS